jgi:hypothetical protein
MSMDAAVAPRGLILDAFRLLEEAEEATLPPAALSRYRLEYSSASSESMSDPVTDTASSLSK